MVQRFEEVYGTDYVDEGIIKILDRDISALSTMNGETFPENVPEGTLFNDVKNKKLYHFKDGKWELLISYANLYKTSAELKRLFQPLADYLTKYSSVNVTQQGFIAYDTFYPFTNYFKNYFLANTSKDSLFAFLNLADLSKVNVAQSVMIEDGTVTMDKLGSDIITFPPFTSGDIRMSFAKSSVNNNEWIKLGVGLTVGNTASNATYTGIMYKDLFKKLWLNTNLNLLNQTGYTIKRGSTADSDWNGNCKMQLPDRPDLFPIKAGTKLFESRSGGATFSFNVDKPGYYRVTLVGGGGGSTASAHGRNYLGPGYPVDSIEGE